MKHTPMRPPNGPSSALAMIPLPCDRESLAAIVARLVDILDAIDGDPDIEANGDEFDGTGGEDDFKEHGDWRLGPGCPVSDPGK